MKKSTLKNKQSDLIVARILHNMRRYPQVYTHNTLTLIINNPKLNTYIRDAAKIRLLELPLYELHSTSYTIPSKRTRKRTLNKHKRTRRTY